MTINVEGPDGSTFEFPDNTPRDVVTGALGRHYGHVPAEPAADIGQGRAEGTTLLRGIPIASAWTDKAVAALNAAAQPVIETGLSHAPTFGERYREDLPRVTQGTNAYEEANPVASKIIRMTGGAGAMAPLGAIAPVAKVMGMTGTLPQMVMRGGATGFGIGSADTLAHGGTPEQALESGVINAGAAMAMPGAGRLLGLGARTVRNLVGSAERIPHSVDLAGTQVPVKQSYVTPTDAIGSKEQQDIAGVHGPEAEQIAKAAEARTQAATQQAAQQFGEQMRGGPGPAQPMADKSAAADQTITELAQQHNDQEQAQARADAQEAAHVGHLNAEEASIRGNPSTPLGAPEVQPRTIREAMEATQQSLQAREQASRNNYNRLYTEAGQSPGTYHPAAWQQVGQSVRNTMDRQPQRPVISAGLTPNTNAGFGLIDNQLGMNYVQNAMQRGDMVRLPDGRVVPRPLTPGDVESVRKQLVGLLADARNVQARGGSGTDAYAMQQLLDAFDLHHQRVLSTPGAFTGDAAAYRNAIENARAAFSQHKDTFANQRRGDNVGPTIEKIYGAHNAEPMPAEPMGTAVLGPESNPGGGNSPLIAAHLRDIFGANSPEVQNLRQAALSHVFENPDGTPRPIEKRASRLAKYAGSQHAEVLFSPAERTRLMNHANELRAQATREPAPPVQRTTAQKAVDKLAVEQNPLSFVKQIFAANGDLSAGAHAMLEEIKGRVSQRTFNSIREAMWLHLIEKPEGLVNWQPRELSNRIARFLANPAAKVVYEPNEIGVLRQFQQHFDKMVPLPNTTNSSGSTVMAAKLARGAARHFFKMLGLTHGLSGYAIGHMLDEAVGRTVQARQIAKTKDLFLGKRASVALNNQYEQAGAMLSNLARPASLSDQNGPR